MTLCVDPAAVARQYVLQMERVWDFGPAGLRMRGRVLRVRMRGRIRDAPWRGL